MRLSWAGNWGRLTGIFVFFVLVSATPGSDSNRFLIKLPTFDAPITVDGYIDEQAWKSAAKVQEFFSFRPVDGQPAEERTAVLMGYDASALYVAFICFDSEPELIRASVTRRDEIFDDDIVILYLDTFNDGGDAYQFAFNPYGIQADGIFIDAVGEDFTPDFIIYSSGRRFKGGFIVEAEIPFKSLRFPHDQEMTWGISVLRRINHKDRDIIWPAISKNSPAFVPQFAKIYGLKAINGGNNIEVLPELTTAQHSVQGASGLEEGQVEADFGLNLKLGLTSNITLDMAWNPDFSQVEADADKVDVNRRFPLFYDEKRPFFLEGNTIFQTPINAVYTRRFVDPQYGIKLTGSAGGFQMGLLSSVDNYYGSEYYLQTNPALYGLADPNEYINRYRDHETYESIVRLRKEIWDYSYLGLLFSDWQQKDQYSRAYGIDGNLYIANEYLLTFQALNSQAQNYFDSEERQDPAFYASLYRGSRNFNFQLYYNDIYPDFELANGFLERQDYREGGVQVWYNFLSADGFFNLISPSIFINRMFNHDGELIESFLSPALQIETAYQTSLSLRYYRQFEEFYGSSFEKNQYALTLSNKTLAWLFIDADIVGGDGIYYSYDPFLGYSHYMNFSLELKPRKDLSFQLRSSNYLFNGWNEGLRYRVSQDIYRLRSTYQISRPLAVRLILEQNNYYRDLDINFLFSYQPTPGTLFFLGYNDYFIRSNRTDFKRVARGLFSKLSYLFRF
jgi:hypothetical protein